MVVQQRGIDLRGLLLVAISSAWLAGIFLDSLLPLPALALLIGAVGALVCIIPLRSDVQGRTIMLVIACTLLGGLRYSLSLPTDDPQAVSSFIGPHVVNIQGIVADEPKLTEHSRILIINANSISSGNTSTWQPVHGQITVITRGTMLETPYGANYGDRVELQGKLQPPDPQQSPGIFSSMLFPRVHVVQNSSVSPISLLYHFRVYLSTLITQLLPQPQAALLIALFLSLRTPALHPEVQDFNVTGTAHLIAPSGFKVTIIAGMITAIMSRLYEKQRRKRQKVFRHRHYSNWRHWFTMTFVLFTIFVYTLLSGAGPAAIRAGIMGGITVVAPRLGRTYNVYTALSFSAILMTLVDPFLLWDAGFLLSFLGTLGIVLLTPFFQRLLHALTVIPFGHQIVEIIASTLAAQIATTPIFAIVFHEISFIGPLANILTVPLLGISLLAGILLCILGIYVPLLATLFSWAVQPLLSYILFIIHWCANVPFAYVTAPGLDSILSWGYYAILVSLFIAGRTFSRSFSSLPSLDAHAHSRPLLSRRMLYLLQASVALLAILVTANSALTTQPDGRLSLTFLAVGQPAQGDALLVRTPDGKTALIDGGADASALAQQLDSRLPSWQRSLDMVILTTPRIEAIQGLQDIITRYQIGSIYDTGMLHPNATYALWRHTIQLQHIPYQQVLQGMNIALGAQTALQVLSPASPLHKGSNEARDNALIFRLVSANVTLLFLGVAAESAYALQTLLSDIALNYLRVQIVDIAEAKGKPFPVELTEVLQQAKPSYLVVTPALNTKQRTVANNTSNSGASAPLPQNITTGDWQIEQIAQVGTVAATGSDGSLNISIS